MINLIMFLLLISLNSKEVKHTSPRIEFRPIIDSLYFTYTRPLNSNELRWSKHTEYVGPLMDSLNKIADLDNERANQLPFLQRINTIIPKYKYNKFRLYTDTYNGVKVFTGFRLEYSNFDLDKIDSLLQKPKGLIIFNFDLFWIKSNTVKISKALTDLYYSAPYLFLWIMDFNKNYKYKYEFYKPITLRQIEDEIKELKRIKKNSFYWYKSVIETNGEEL